jgi:hypothetical protein
MNLNPHYVAYRERVARVRNQGFRVIWCDVCRHAPLAGYYACPKAPCSTQSREWYCQEHFDEHYRQAHNPETHAMDA